MAEENNLPVQISTLRKLLGTDVIATVPGRGYRCNARPLPADATAAGSPAAAATPRATAVAQTATLPAAATRPQPADTDPAQLRTNLPARLPSAAP